MINEHIFLASNGILLVPYLPQHVPQYHRWMCRSDLLEATESEPLSLEEEYENQRSWLYSFNKLTFIIMALRESTENSMEKISEGKLVENANNIPKSGKESLKHIQLPLQELSASLTLDTCIDLTDYEEITSMEHINQIICTSVPYQMIGDCNLFLLEDEENHNEENDDDSKDGALRSSEANLTFEIEVMIAEESFRRRGFAQRAVQMMMCYARRILNATRCIAKILETNAASIALFTEKLHFQVQKCVPVFNEIHLVCQLNNEINNFRPLLTKEKNSIRNSVVVEKQQEVKCVLADNEEDGNLAIEKELKLCTLTSTVSQYSMNSIICGPYTSLASFGVTFSLCNP